MPEHHIKTIIEVGGINAALGIVGGGVKVALGLSANESLLKEIARIIFIAMPFGWLAGGIAQENNMTEYVTFSAAVFTGLISHNIAKAAMDIGVKELFGVLTGRGNGKSS